MSREDSSSTRHHNGSDDDKDRQLRRERRKLDKLRKKMKKAEQKSRKKSKKKSKKHKKRKHSRHRSTSSSSASASDDHAGITKRSRQVSPHVGRSDPPPSETQTSGTRQQVEAESQPASAPKPGSAEWFLQLSARESKTGGVGTVHVAKKVTPRLCRRYSVIERTCINVRAGCVVAGRVHQHRDWQEP